MGYLLSGVPQNQGSTDRRKSQLIENWSKKNPGQQLNAYAFHLNESGGGLPSYVTGVPEFEPISWSPAQPVRVGETKLGPQNTSQALLNSLLNQATNTGRGYIDEAAMGAKSAADTAYGAMIRNMSRMGVNPQSPRFAAQMGKWANNRAATEAAARNEASRAGQREGFGRQMSLWNAITGLEESDKSRGFQAGQAEASRAFSREQTQQQRGWNVADRGLMAEADRAETEAFLQALGQNQPKAAAPSGIVSPYSRAAGARNTVGYKPKTQATAPSMLSMQIPPPVEKKPLTTGGRLSGRWG